MEKDKAYLIESGSKNLIIRAGNAIAITNKLLAESDTRNLLSSSKYVRIGAQEWLTDNLNVAHYRNGDPIPYVSSAEEWSSLKTGAWCYYNNDPSTESKFGKLYNWFAINDPRGFAPEGWQVPCIEEWKILAAFVEYQKMCKDTLKNEAFWFPSANESDLFEFNDLQGGVRNSSGYFDSSNFKRHFWTTSEFDTIDAACCEINCAQKEMRSHNLNKKTGLSIRCCRLVADCINDEARRHYNIAVQLSNEASESDDLWKANEEATKAIGLNPGYLKAHVFLGRGIGSGTVHRIMHYSIAIQIKPDPMIYHERGLMRHGYYDGVSFKEDHEHFKSKIDDYTSAIKLNPNFAQAYYNRGYTKRKINDISGAIEDYNKVHALQLLCPLLKLQACFLFF